MKKVISAVVSIIALLSFTVVSYAASIEVVNSIWSGGYSCSNGATVTITPSSTTPTRQIAIYRVEIGGKYVSGTTVETLRITAPVYSESSINAKFIGWREYSSFEDSSNGVYTTSSCVLQGKGYYYSSNNKKLVFYQKTYNYS